MAVDQQRQEIYEIAEAIAPTWGAAAPRSKR